MSVLHINKNRPVHLARRDVFFERAVDLLCMPVKNPDPVERLHHIEHIVSLLRTAEKHAFFALRPNGAAVDEENFLHFLKLISENIRSVHAMVGHQIQLESGRGFLADFLGTKPEDSVTPALHYQRRAEDILQGLWHMLRLAHAPYARLREANMESLSPDEKERYTRAEASFREEVEAKYKPTDPAGRKRPSPSPS